MPSPTTPPTEVSTHLGTPQQARARLGKSQAGQVLVVEFGTAAAADGHTSANATQVSPVLAENLRLIASSMYQALQQPQAPHAIERITELLVPRTPPEPHIIREAFMQARARKAVLESGDWLTAAQLAQVAGLSDRNPSAQPNKWKKAGQIFAIQNNGVDYFPAYGLDADTAYRPRKALAQVIAVFAGRKDGWQMAYWFHADNSYLGGQRPQDLLAIDPARVIAAAQDEVLETAHA